MRKLSSFLFGLLFSITVLIYTSNSNIIFTKAEENKVYIGGMPAGFTLNIGGGQVIGICDIKTQDGLISPGINAGIKVGDIISKIADIPVKNIKDINELLSKSKGKILKMDVIRGNEELSLKIKPEKDVSSNKYKIGVIMRDEVSGVGTITYINKKTGRFGSLGHPVIGENNNKLTISNGNVYPCSIISIKKGIRGKAGELRGMFLNENIIGKAENVCDCGIYGIVDKNYKYLNNPCVEISNVSNVTPGKAYIYSTINGITPEKFDIEIVKVNRLSKNNKHFVLKITDENLISKTGGIVQGMSGSPIIQDGKLIGAVTHVFLNDPTRGYGISINSMINN